MSRNAAYSPPRVSAEDYARAEARLAPNMPRLVAPVHVRPAWVEGGQMCVPVWDREGCDYRLVDCRTGAQGPAFDQAAVAEDIAAVTGKPVDPRRLPIADLAFDAKGALQRFTMATTTFARDEDDRFVRDPGAAPVGELAAPDRSATLRHIGFDLELAPRDGGPAQRLTTDGIEAYAYGKSPDANNMTITLRRMGSPTAPIALWSPDSRKILTHRLDERGVEMLHLLQSAPPEGVRPVLHAYRVPFPGEAHVARAELIVIDRETGRIVAIDHPAVLSIVATPIERRAAWWSADGRKIYFLAAERGDKALSLVEADAETGAARTILTERGESYVEAQPFLGGQPNVRVLDDGRRVIWYSERDGWGHLYLYDGVTGDLLNQITTGQWTVGTILHVDAKAERLFLTGCGREPGRDPYYRHVYSVGFDGSDLRLLTPEDADHQVAIPPVRIMLPPDAPVTPDTGVFSFSPDGSVFLDCFSRVNTTPKLVLRRADDGSVITTLAEADISALQAAGWIWPEPFSVKARDGETDLYGAIFRPSHFDPAKRYPVIDAIYPGPHTYRAPKSSFGGEPNALFLYQSSAALAELGFIVISVDGMGTAGRSKAFHDVSYGKLEEAGGLADHVAALRQLAARHPEIDLDRVGIWGYSAGGFASARAILEFPEIYKVAVSSAGNHDNRLYHAAWGEKYHGFPSERSYEPQITARLAERLTGKLLLTCGELDDNAHPAMTHQLAAALIAANKDFDLLVMPNRNHGYGVVDGYYIRRAWDFFVRHLLGAAPPENYRVADLGPFPMVT